MIEYFVRPMAGVRTAITFDELVAYRAQRGMGFRTRPPAVVEGADRRRHARSAAGLRARQAARRRGRSSSRSPARTCWRRRCSTSTTSNVPDLAMAIADALAAQVRHLDADVVQIDEANLPGSPDEWQWAAAAMNRVLDAVKTTPAVHLCFGNYGGQIDPEGQLGAS